jgi:hypothetical protein
LNKDIILWNLKQNVLKKVKYTVKITDIVFSQKLS